MTFRPARESDAPAIDAFLATRRQTSMFLRSNLAECGPCGAGDMQFTTRMWLSGPDSGLTGVVGLSKAGWLLLQLPGGAPAVPLRQILAGATLHGVNGDADQVAALLRSLDLHDVPRVMDDVQPLYSLDLADLVIAAGETWLRRPEPADSALLAGWRARFLTEIMSMPPAMALLQANRDLETYRANDRLRLLCDAAGPVAMTAFNAALPDMVQIGNVFTPPDNRGRGFARRAVSLHLNEARQAGVTEAILASASPAANRAYEAIGFRRCGSYAIIHFAEPQSMEPLPCP